MPTSTISTPAPAIRPAPGPVIGRPGSPPPVPPVGGAVGVQVGEVPAPPVGLTMIFAVLLHVSTLSAYFLSSTIVPVAFGVTVSMRSGNGKEISCPASKENIKPQR